MHVTMIWNQTVRNAAEVR